MDLLCTLSVSTPVIGCLEDRLLLDMGLTTPRITLRVLSQRATGSFGRWADLRHRKVGGPLLAIGLLVVLVAWIFRLQLFDRWSFPWDFLGTYTTTPAFVAATIGRGHPLLWSPFVASGFPVAADPQAGMYFPGWWLLGALHVPLTLRVLTTVQVAHVLIGAVGVLLLARARRLTWMWATVAAVGFVFFGGFYGQAEHADIFRGFAYLPWLLWALTPPDTSGRWARLAAVVPVVWLIASAAYPGQIISFAISSLVYVVVALRASGEGAWRRYRMALTLTVVASGAVCMVVLLPYIRAEQAGELYRTVEPTAGLRAMFSISPIDVFGLYLNNFAWTHEGTITTWVVGVPILIGLACARRKTFTRQAPLLACGLVALVLGMSPKVGFIGQAMTSVRPLFPSRFPASDYKAIVALALIVISVDAWSQVAARSRGRAWIIVLPVACLLAGGALLVPRTYAEPTRDIWLVMGMIVASGALVLVRPSARILAGVLVLMLTIDGVREINDYRLGGTNSPWQVPPSALAFYRHRDGYVRKLPELLKQAPVSRPARVPAAATAEPNASGWVADAYHETDYDPTLERVLWNAEHDPAWSALLLAPWQAYTFPCSAVGCSDRAVRLPAPTKWHTNSNIRTLSYGADAIVYSVKVSHPVLMVENELAIPGWQANTTRVRPIQAGAPLRAWRLSPGTYDFTATFQEPNHWLQEWIALVALCAWLGCVAVLGWRWLAPTKVKR
jgi:hypothetical protein